MNNEVRCPKCKSNQISANKKGFSGTSTIGSNRIIITCLNCAHEFLPGQGYKEIEIPLSAEEKAKNVAELDAKILRLCEAGQPLQAVKLYKDATGLGLREAKNYVDYLSAQHLPQGSSAGNKGCAGAAIFLVAFVVIVALVFEGLTH